MKILTNWLRAYLPELGVDDSQLAEDLTLRGIALSREGQMSGAKESFDQALQSCPESLPALEGAAQIAYSTRSPGASALLHRILLQRPDDQTSHAMLGTLSFQHGDCPAAIDHFDHDLTIRGLLEIHRRNIAPAGK